MKYFYIFILTVCGGMTLSAQQSKAMTVSAGTGVYIKSGTPVSASEITLKSTSDSFSTLFINENLAPTTTVHYDRYVNIVGQAGVNGGNDLLSLPVKKDGETYASFLTHSKDGILTNADVLPQHPTIATTYAFGPYDNNVQKYINYDVSTNGAIQLKPAIGYRAAARTAGQTLRFTGTVSTEPETVEISTSRRNRWNSVGNPYPTYLDSQKFLHENSSKLDPNTASIYGYNSGTKGGPGTFGNFTIINVLTSTPENIAPGQGFLVANKLDGITRQIVFTPQMRVFKGSDDFILGRTEVVNPMLRIKAHHTTADFATEVYFNANSTQGLDVGYDAAVFDGADTEFMIYTHLLKENAGYSMAIQSLGLADMDDFNIPVGVKAPKGKTITFSIENTTLPQDINVYLEDKVTNTFTLLNDAPYSFKTETALSGTGRFYLTTKNVVLSLEESTLENLNIFATDRMLIINGQLLADTKVLVYDIQGRNVLQGKAVSSLTTNKISTTSLGTGIYVVKLDNGKQSFTKKVLIK